MKENLRFKQLQLNDINNKNKQTNKQRNKLTKKTPKISTKIYQGWCLLGQV